MHYSCLFILAALFMGHLYSQEAVSTPSPPLTTVFQILSESTAQQRDGSSITFRQVAPPLVAPQQVQPPVQLPAPGRTAAEQETLSQVPVKEAKVLSISASVYANGFSAIRWTSGESQRLQAVSNVDFRFLAGLGSLETELASYFVIISAGAADQPMNQTEALAASSLPVNGRASVALLSESAAMNQEDESALHAMEALLDYFDSHREELIALHAQREQDRVARALAEHNAPPRHSVVHFWRLQPAQRTAIQE